MKLWKDVDDTIHVRIFSLVISVFIIYLYLYISISISIYIYIYRSYGDTISLVEVGSV